MKRYSILIAAITATIVLFASGCGYFNTFYNAQKKFNEAERDTRSQERQNQRQQQQQQQPPTQPPGAPGGTPGQGAGAASDKYRKVIETSSKLLEGSSEIPLGG